MRTANELLRAHHGTKRVSQQIFKQLLLSHCLEKIAKKHLETGSDLGQDCYEHLTLTSALRCKNATTLSEGIFAVGIESQLDHINEPYTNAIDYYFQCRLFP
jgi:hypothetical protein